MAIIDLCELLLNELQVTNDINIVNEINPLISKLMDYGQKINVYYFVIEGYILQGKIALITFKIKDARRFLMQAQKIAETHGYNQIAIEISSLHEDMVQQLEMWDYLEKINAPISKRMELARLSEDLTELIRSNIVNTDQISEKKVTVYKERNKCMVCLGEIEGFNTYICPKCDSIYCENCARALVKLENACWVCDAPIDESKPVKPFSRDEEEIEEIEVSEKPQKKPRVDKKPIY